MLKLTDFLARPDILMADGATGTQLQKDGLKPGASPERWNLENPDAVRALHRSYIEAGANIVLTNTFGGTRFCLTRHSLEEQTREINAAAAKLAREVAGDSVFVFGDIGPSGELLKPLGKLTCEDAAAGFAEQATGLLAGGVNAILIETMSDINEAKAAIEGASKACAR